MAELWWDVSFACTRPSSDQAQSEQCQNKQDTDPREPKVTMWVHSLITPGRILLVSNVTLVDEMIWIHSRDKLLPAGIARYMTHSSVAESRAKRRDRCCRFLERSVAEEKGADGRETSMLERIYNDIYFYCQMRMVRQTVAGYSTATKSVHAVLPCQGCSAFILVREHYMM